MFHEANEVAHGLTRLALGIKDELVWLKKFPPTIESLVVKDASFI